MERCEVCRRKKNALIHAAGQVVAVSVAQGPITQQHCLCVRRHLGIIEPYTINLPCFLFCAAVFSHLKFLFAPIFKLCVN